MIDMKRDMFGRFMPKQLVIKPCPEHGFVNGYIMCSYCIMIRKKAIRKLHLKEDDINE